MRGQIVKKRPGVWLVRIPTGRDAAGTRKYHNHTIHGTRRDAEQYLTQTQRAMDTGTFVQISREAFASFAQRWLESTARLSAAPKTFADYEGLMRRHLIPRLGHLQLSKIRTDHVQKVYSEMSDAGLSAATIRYAHSVLHNSLSAAVAWRLIAINPAKGARLPKLQRREISSLDPGSASAFLKAASTSRWEALCYVLLAGGLRPGEALALRWSDLDGTVLRVQRSLSSTADGGFIFKDVKTSSGRRAVHLPPVAVEALERHRSRQQVERCAAGSDWANLELMFCTLRGTPLDWRTTSRRYIRPILAAAGIKEFRPYDLRHSNATLLLLAGVSPKIVSERLGHHSTAFTLDTYSHVLPVMQGEAAAHLDAMLRPSQQLVPRVEIVSHA